MSLQARADHDRSDNADLRQTFAEVFHKILRLAAEHLRSMEL